MARCTDKATGPSWQNAYTTGNWEESIVTSLPSVQFTTWIRLTQHCPSRLFYLYISQCSFFWVEKETTQGFHIVNNFENIYHI